MNYALRKASKPTAFNLCAPILDVIRMKLNEFFPPLQMLVHSLKASNPGVYSPLALFEETGYFKWCPLI